MKFLIGVMPERWNEMIPAWSYGRSASVAKCMGMVYRSLQAGGVFLPAVRTHWVNGQVSHLIVGRPCSSVGTVCGSMAERAHGNRLCFGPVMFGYPNSPSFDLHSGLLSSSRSFAH